VSARQRGVAAITAILIVAVAASAATIMLAQQSAMVDQATLISSRAQADMYARAGLDWARGVVMQDTRSSNNVDSLDEAWAQPIVGLPVDRALIGGAPEPRTRVLGATLAATIAGAVIHPLVADLDDATLRAELWRHIRKMLPSR